MLSGSLGSSGKRIPKSEDEARLNEHKKRDAKAFYLIQQLLNRSLFPQISIATLAKDAWE